MNKHTPTPYKWVAWEQAISINSPECFGVAFISPDLDSANGIPSELDRANAEFIVTACNNHDALIAMLELAIRYLEHPDVLAVTKDMALSGEAVNERIRTALKQAKGEA